MRDSSRFFAASARSRKPILCALGEMHAEVLPQRERHHQADRQHQPGGCAVVEQGVEAAGRGFVLRRHGSQWRYRDRELSFSRIEAGCQPFPRRRSRSAPAGPEEARPTACVPAADSRLTFKCALLSHAGPSPGTMPALLPKDSGSQVSMRYEFLVGLRYTRSRKRAQGRNRFISFISFVSMLGIAWVSPR
jgi:ABC-type transport system, involved in lipoprotein release, permease component